MNIDLHIHSNNSSDAEFSVSDIMVRAKMLGIKTLAITDHNSVKGVAEAIRLGADGGIRVIPGIEIDCAHEGINLHLLGYNIDWCAPEFAALECKLFAEGVATLEPMIANMHALGVNVAIDEVLAAANGQIPCAEHIAEVVLHKSDAADCEILHPYLPGGERSDMPYINFYWDYFSQGKPAYIPVEFMKLTDAIQLIKATGGIPVIAHPGANLKDNPEFINKIISAGVEGIEIFNNYHTQEQQKYFTGKARQNNLLMTAGSDFHGKNKPKIQLGQYPCADCSQIWRG